METENRSQLLTPSPRSQSRPTSTPSTRNPSTSAASDDLSLEITHFLRHDFYSSSGCYDDTDDHYFEDFWELKSWLNLKIMHVSAQGIVPCCDYHLVIPRFFQKWHFVTKPISFFYWVAHMYLNDFRRSLWGHGLIQKNFSLIKRIAYVYSF